MIKIPLSKLNTKKAENFAKAVTKTTKQNYAKRNQYNRTKIELDAKFGHIGEMAWHRFFKEKGFNVSAVDDKIYHVKQKSWKPDLEIKLKNKIIRVHVKTQKQDSAYKYGTSWVFQKACSEGQKSSRHSDPITDRTQITENDYLALCVIGSKMVTLIAFVKAELIHEHKLWSNPKVEYLQKTKTVIYKKDLEKLGNEIWKVDDL